MTSFDVTFDAILARDASPSSRIIVFYLTSQGEVIVDSIEFQVDALFANEVGELQLKLLNAIKLYFFFIVINYHRVFIDQPGRGYCG